MGRHGVVQTHTAGKAGHSHVSDGWGNMKAAATAVNPVNLSIAIKIDDAVDRIKLWNVSQYPGVPTQAKVKLSSKASILDLYHQVQAFVEKTCDEYTSGQCGSSQSTTGIASGVRTDRGMKWTPTVNALQFEGELLPTNAACMVGSYLKDGDEFQATGKVHMVTYISRTQNMGGVSAKEVMAQCCTIA